MQGTACIQAETSPVLVSLILRGSLMRMKLVAVLMSMPLFLCVLLKGLEHHRCTARALCHAPSPTLHPYQSPHPVPLQPKPPLSLKRGPVECNSEDSQNLVLTGDLANCFPNFTYQWYPELELGGTVGANPSVYGQSYNSTINIDFWGEYFKSNETNGIDLQVWGLLRWTGALGHIVLSPAPQYACA